MTAPAAAIRRVRAVPALVAVLARAGVRRLPPVRAERVGARCLRAIGIAARRDSRHLAVAERELLAVRGGGQRELLGSKYRRPVGRDPLAVSGVRTARRPLLDRRED